MPAPSSHTGSGSTPVAPNAEPTLRPISEAEAAADLRNMGFDFSHPISIYPDCEMPGWGGTPTLQQVLKWRPDLATAAIVTVVGPDGSPRWNTPDGQRWTQPEAIAARMHGLVPAILTPWRLVRSGPNFVGSVPDSVVVWREGGLIVSDSIIGGECILGAEPAPGRSYLIFFGAPQLMTGSYREIIAAWPYDPVTHALDGPWGRIWLAPPPPAGGRSS
jgi:hypothetical protein